MRPALLLAAFGLAGCLSAPTGLDRDGGGVIDAGPDAETAHVWPPAGGVEFAAIASGDLSGSAAEDLIAVNVGEDGTGVFLLTAEVDVELATPGLGDTYTEYERIDTLAPPVAALIVGDRVVVLDNPTGGARITVLETDGLDEIAQYATGGPTAPALARPTLRILGFGPSGETLGIVNGDDFRILDIDDLDDPSPVLIAVPAPPGGWGTVQLVDLVDDGGLAFVAALGMAAFTSPVPMGGAQVWSANQRGTQLWTAQVAGAIPYEGGNDGEVDLIGLDPSGGANAQLCMVDVVGDATATCLSTLITEDNGFVLLYDNVAPGLENDLVVALPGAIGTRIEVFPVLRVTGGALVADTSPVVQTFVGSNAQLVTADLDTINGPRVIVQLADDGDLTCITIRPEGTLRCSD